MIQKVTKSLGLKKIDLSKQNEKYLITLILNNTEVCIINENLNKYIHLL